MILTLQTFLPMTHGEKKYDASPPHFSMILMATQMMAPFEMMVGQEAKNTPVFSRNNIVKNSTSIDSIWQTICQYYGLQFISLSLFSTSMQEN